MQEPMKNKRKTCKKEDCMFFQRIKDAFLRSVIAPLRIFWNNISFRKKTILYTSIILYSCILIFGMLVYGRAVEGMDQIEQESIVRRLTGLDEDVKQHFSSYSLVTNALLLDHNFQKKLEECPDNFGDATLYDSEVHEYLTALCNSVKRSAQWKLYFTCDRSMSMHQNIGVTSNIESEAWFDQLLSQKRRIITWRLEEATPERGSYFSCSLAVANRVTREIPAYFKMEIEISGLLPIIRSTMEQIDAVFLLCDQDGTVLWSSDARDHSDYILPYEGMPVLEPVSVSGSLGQRTVIALDGGKYSYTIMCIQEEKSTLTHYMDFGLSFLIILSLIIVSSYLFLHTSAGIVDGRIVRLTADIKALDETNLHYVADKSGKDEVGNLSRAFSELVDRINKLIQEERKHEEERFELEVEALQSQINPHFLFNTLSIINLLASEIEADNISHALNSLANFYRYALNDGKKMTTLGRELSMLDNYLAICSIRHNNRLRVCKDIDPRTLEYSIPKLVLQPFCENALFHGFSGDSEKEPTISISAKLNEDHLLVVVSDNGEGMSRSELQHAWETGFAITNVHKRIQMLYGEQYGVSITSAPMQGTQVSIKLGLLNWENEENR